MYRMLLVEDEPIVRLALKSMINWTEYGFDEVLECVNGKKALEIINKDEIDIVITDINMPVMNGIELIKEVRKLNISTQFLVLSAYSDYDLVRNAFKLGVNDYILKTELDPDKILKMVLSILEARNKVNSNKSLKLNKEDMLRKIISGEFKSDEVINIQDLRLEHEYYMSLYILVDNFRIVEQRYNNCDINEFTVAVKNTIGQVLQSINNGEIFSISPKEYGVLLSFSEDSKDEIIKKINDITSKIRYSLKNFINIEVTIGVSKLSKNFKKLKELYEEAQSNARFRFIYGKGKNIYPKDIDELNNMKKCKNSNISQSIMLEMTKDEGVLQALDRLDEEKCLAELKNVFKIRESFFVDSLEKIYIYYLEISLMIIQYVIKDEDNTIEMVIGDNADIYDNIKKLDTIDEIENWMFGFVKKIIVYLKTIKQSENYVVKQAKEFVNNNYKEKITLEMVGKAIGFSKAYFSKIFTEETGDNFSTYLTNVRIEKAKELLLKTDMKIYEVCDNVGYSSIEHFSRTFKRTVGVSPLQYKNNNLN